MLDDPKAFDAAQLWEAVDREKATAITIVGDPFGKPMLRAASQLRNMQREGVIVQDARGRHPPHPEHRQVQDAGGRTERHAEEQREAPPAMVSARAASILYSHLPLSGAKGDLLSSCA